MREYGFLFTRILTYKDRIVYRKIRASENPYSVIFYAICRLDSDLI